MYPACFISRLFGRGFGFGDDAHILSGSPTRLDI